MKNFMIATMSASQLVFAQDWGDGHARVELLLASQNYQAGTSLQAAVRITYEDGWHGYWINPGEGGMKTEIKWNLPAGWAAGPLLFPTPSREMTGELACYGYEGEVVIPVLLSIPAGATGEVKLSASLSWLSCNDKGCAPGDATISATITSGEKQSCQHHAIIQQSLDQLPLANEEIAVALEETTEGKIIITLTNAGELDLAGAQLFPITEQSLDPKEPIMLKKIATGFQAIVNKNEYTEGSLKKLEFLIAGKSLKRAIVLSWEKK
jgi:DsbC/DsbD-like thiol-disulfide interchange protein